MGREEQNSFKQTKLFLSVSSHLCSNSDLVVYVTKTYHSSFKRWEQGCSFQSHKCLWLDGYERGLTKGGGKLGLPAFFSLKAVTTQKSTRAVWVGSALLAAYWKCSLATWYSDNLGISHPFFPTLCTSRAHVFVVDMMSFVHSRICLFLVVSVAQVLFVKCQDGNSGKYILVSLF